MIPREIVASLYFAERRRKREAAEQLALGALAARGEPRALKRQIKNLQRDREGRKCASTRNLMNQLQAKSIEC